jgi:hypothetical protein
MKMGDCGNVIIKDEIGQQVCLYTHWRGSELRAILKSALRRRQRWDDAPYLARIIFCEMIKGDEAAETGFGISTRSEGSAEIIIDVKAQTAAGRPFEDFIK